MNTSGKAPGKTYGETLTVRVRRQDARLMRAAADARGLTLSAFVRRTALLQAIEVARRADPAERHGREGDVKAAALKAALTSFAETEEVV